MKAAFVGKGGSGKTTLAALFCRFLAVSAPDEDAPRVLALDADINQHLAVALGADPDEAALLPALGDRLGEIKEYLRGDNPRIPSAAAMLKTTPPGPGSRIVGVAEANPLYERLVRPINGVRLAVTGPFAADDLGVACYHSKVGAVELLLNHMADGPGEYAVVDMTAGADSFASGLFTRFDLTFLVCEPTVRSVGVYRQYVGYARDHGVRVVVVGNKVDDAEDVEFLRAEAGDDLLCWFGRSGFVKAAERGRHLPIDELEPANAHALAELKAALDASTKDWIRYAEQAAEFHTRNALAWGNDRAGTDLTDQIAPGFTLAPATVAAR
ncbi:ATP-binding protein [Dactylosporangium sp. NPDC000244]|uniref:ATP-binding protein n=1 Tax=Dactylosporangium sp. NPDC000244 TaxID=3154365 RepID=UPI00331D9E2A